MPLRRTLFLDKTGAYPTLGWAFIDVQQSNAMTIGPSFNKTGLPLVALVALLI
jgi:hypothetical protein